MNVKDLHLYDIISDKYGNTLQVVELNCMNCTKSNEYRGIIFTAVEAVNIINEDYPQICTHDSSNYCYVDRAINSSKLISSSNYILY